MAPSAQGIARMTDIRLTGKTRLYAIVGDPVAQVRSPEVFTPRFAEAGVDAVLVAVHVPVAHFDAAMPALLSLGNLDGVLVTVPFKARMLPFADHVGTNAKAIGAVNALRRELDGTWTGDMFDGIGFVHGIERKGARVQGRRVVLFGAGGAGSAIAAALAAAGVASIHLVDVEAGRAAALVEKLAPAFPQCEFSVVTKKPDDVDMIVNASPVGMKPDDPMPAELGPLSRDTLVGDVVITPTATALIRHAQRHGCTWADGRDMHGGQVDTLLAFFAGASRGSHA
jgi:shikimate dehydrogenase